MVWELHHLRHACTAVCLLTGLAGSGCVHTAKVSCWQPAVIDTSGMTSVAVLPFDGPHGAEIHDVLVEQIGQSLSYNLVDTARLAPIVQTAALTEEPVLDGTLLSKAHSAGVDAVIVGEVEVYRWDSAHPRPDEDRLMLRWVENARRERAEGHGIVAVSFRLIDVATGDVRRAHTVTRTVAGSDTRSEELLIDLQNGCIHDFLALLEPARKPVEMQLADADWYRPGSFDIRRGSRLARQGRWTEAEAAWLRAATRDSRNDAAVFNLALAAMNRQDFGQAEAFAMQALRIRHSECYTQGLEEIRRQRSAYERSLEQRQNAILPVSATAEN